MTLLGIDPNQSILWRRADWAKKTQVHKEPRISNTGKMPDDNEVEESSDVASENDYDDADNSNENDDDTMGNDQTYLKQEDGDGAAPAKKPKLDPKDPLRPRRKKARRACFACQRAHLTCGKLLLIFIS